MGRGANAVAEIEFYNRAMLIRVRGSSGGGGGTGEKHRAEVGIAFRRDGAPLPMTYGGGDNRAGDGRTLPGGIAFGGNGPAGIRTHSLRCQKANGPSGAPRAVQVLRAYRGSPHGPSSLTSPSGRLLDLVKRCPKPPAEKTGPGPSLRRSLSFRTIPSVSFTHLHVFAPRRKRVAVLVERSRAVRYAFAEASGTMSNTPRLSTPLQPPPTPTPTPNPLTHR